MSAKWWVSGGQEGKEEERERMALSEEAASQLKMNGKETLKDRWEERKRLHIEEEKGKHSEGPSNGHGACEKVRNRGS